MDTLIIVLMILGAYSFLVWCADNRRLSKWQADIEYFRAQEEAENARIRGLTE